MLNHIAGIKRNAFNVRICLPKADLETEGSGDCTQDYHILDTKMELCVCETDECNGGPINGAFQVIPTSYTTLLIMICGILMSTTQKH